VSDRDLVLTKLRSLTESEEGAMAQLRACDLLGKSIGLYRDVTETIEPRTSDEIQAELKERLAGIIEKLDTPAASNKVH
jgi:hypothetical protein